MVLPGQRRSHVEPPPQLTEQEVVVHVTWQVAPAVHVTDPLFPTVTSQVAWSQVTLPLGPVEMVQLDDAEHVALQDEPQLPLHTLPVAQLRLQLVVVAEQEEDPANAQLAASAQAPPLDGPPSLPSPPPPPSAPPPPSPPAPPSPPSPPALESAWNDTPLHPSPGATRRRTGSAQENHFRRPEQRRMGKGAGRSLERLKKAPRR